MVKSNIREEAANKLTLCDLILEKIIAGEKVQVDLAIKARKNIKEIMDWLDKRSYKTRKSS